MMGIIGDSNMPPPAQPSHHGSAEPPHVQACYDARGREFCSVAKQPACAVNSTLRRFCARTCGTCVSLVPPYPSEQGSLIDRPRAQSTPLC